MQKLWGKTGIRTELKFKRGEAKTTGSGEEEEKREDWGNLMNIPNGSERGTIYRHQGLPAQKSIEKWFQKLQKSKGICRQTEYASRPVHENVREHTVFMWACFCQHASFHNEPISTLQKRGNVNLRAELFGECITKKKRELPKNLVLTGWVLSPFVILK